MDLRQQVAEAAPAAAVVAAAVAAAGAIFWKHDNQPKDLVTYPAWPSWELEHPGDPGKLVSQL